MELLPPSASITPPGSAHKPAAAISSGYAEIYCKDDDSDMKKLPPANRAGRVWIIVDDEWW